MSKSTRNNRKSADNAAVASNPIVAALAAGLGISAEQLLAQFTPAASNPVDPLTGKTFTPKPDAKVGQLTGGTVDDATYPANNEDGKAFPVPPVYRQRFMRSFTKTMPATIRIAGNDLSIGDCKAFRSSKGNHGITGQLRLVVEAADGVEYTLTGNLNLMLKDYTPAQQ